MDAMIDSWVEQIVMVIAQMPWLGPLLALAAGVLAAFTPCCLSSIPLIVGYISGLGENAPFSIRSPLPAVPPAPSSRSA